jgi:hypothetical protein
MFSLAISNGISQSLSWRRNSTSVERWNFWWRTINKILTIRILIINKFHNNIIHHNRRLILITTRKSLPLVLDKVRSHISQVPNITPIQQLVLDFHRYIQRVQNVPYQHPTQVSRNHRSNLEMTREGRELPQLMMHIGGAITNKV